MPLWFMISVLAIGLMVVGGMYEISRAIRESNYRLTGHIRGFKELMLSVIEKRESKGR